MRDIHKPPNKSLRYLKACIRKSKTSFPLHRERTKNESTIRKFPVLRSHHTQHRRSGFHATQTRRPKIGLINDAITASRGKAQRKKRGKKHREVARFRLHICLDTRREVPENTHRYDRVFDQRTCYTHASPRISI